MATPTAPQKPPAPEKPSFFAKVRETQVWKSVFRHGYPDTQRNRAHAVLSNVFLYVHPVRIRKSGIALSFTWCMGGVTSFLFLVEAVTGILLMFYYRPVAYNAYNDIQELRESIPLGLMRELHRWGAHAMVLTVWLHMFRVFMTGSYKPPREFNWNVGVILQVLTLLLSFLVYSVTLKMYSPTMTILLSPLMLSGCVENIIDFIMKGVDAK